MVASISSHQEHLAATFKKPKIRCRVASMHGKEITCLHSHTARWTEIQVQAGVLSTCTKLQVAQIQAYVPAACAEGMGLRGHDIVTKSVMGYFLVLFWWWKTTTTIDWKPRIMYAWETIYNAWSPLSIVTRLKILRVALKNDLSMQPCVAMWWTFSSPLVYLPFEDTTIKIRSFVEWHYHILYMHYAFFFPTKSLFEIEAD